ncbi:Mersacidin decarboxylase [Polycladomyces sp. WAk]|uniref:Mersacidin decarboxylase n=1 Tax=Polycladomyces zharkentensis TaxID=2807616 RepID=A0ABS2WHB4_9BACL|nr:flavoprotein [Polycladomyces sp. WAk]MBN2908804.1 Mersacidin decarboxylase [Polycladomyces sp. WAk]
MDLDLLKSKNLLVGVSGSISVLGLPSYLSMFSYYFKAVKVVMTPSADRLIPRETVNLLCSGAYTDEKELFKEVSHVELARWADVFIVLPATANILGQAAHGLGNNLLTTVILAYPDPILYFPNMNERMWKKTTKRQDAGTRRGSGCCARTDHGVRDRFGRDGPQLHDSFQGCGNETSL